MSKKTIVIEINDREENIPFDELDEKEIKRKIEQHVLAGYDVEVTKVTVMIGS